MGAEPAEAFLSVASAVKNAAINAALFSAASIIAIQSARVTTAAAANAPPTITKTWRVHRTCTVRSRISRITTTSAAREAVPAPSHSAVATRTVVRTSSDPVIFSEDRRNQRGAPGSVHFRMRETRTWS